MSIKYSCIGDNTKENREHLEKVGYEICVIDSSNPNNDLLVTYPNAITKEGKATYCTYRSSVIALDSYVWDKSRKEMNSINCIGNSELFQAVTAIRDDNDYMQWFTDGKEWILCLGDNFCEWYYSLGKYLPFSLDTIHKAAKSELQEHFKKKE